MRALTAEIGKCQQHRDGRKTRGVQHPIGFRNALGFLPTPLMNERRRILEINYWPIFYPAIALLESISVKEQTSTLECLWGIAEALVARDVTKSHDMTGVILQRLIADREVLKTFYTRPTCASLLTSLEMPHKKERQIPVRMQIGDFACASGTLLSTSSALGGDLIAKTICDASVDVKRLEDGPVGGTAILIRGGGNWINAGLPLNLSRAVATGGNCGYQTCSDCICPGRRVPPSRARLGVCCPPPEGHI